MLRRKNDSSTAVFSRVDRSTVLRSPYEVRCTLSRERSRADRSGGEVCLVMFYPNAPGDRPLQQLASVVIHRVRATDEVGWFAPGKLCAVLPETSAQGAASLARSVCDLARPLGIVASCVVYSYPRPPRRDDDEDRHNGYPRALGANGNDRDGNGHFGNGDGKIAMRLAVERRINGRANHEQLIAFEPLESLLVHSLPLWKRLIDIIGSLLALILSAPVLAVSALAIKATSRGPVLFQQRRSGMGNRPFTIYKLRTMRLDAERLKDSLRAVSEQDGPAFKIANDPRVTRIGRFLRKTSIDEIPQFWNVLKGDMTLVGPRPLPVDESDGCQAWQRQRLSVTPGLTCIWQVAGRSTVTFDEWMRMDMRYIRRRTLLHDLQLMLRTLPAVLLRKGAC